MIASLQDLSVDGMRIVLLGQEAERMTFTTTEDTTLTPGVTNLTLQCTVSLNAPLSRLRANCISHHHLAHSFLIIAKYDSPDYFSSGIIGKNPTFRGWRTNFLLWCGYRKIQSR